MTEVAPSAFARARGKVAGHRATGTRSVSFPEIILAHYLHQLEVYRNRTLDGEWEEPFRRRMRDFEREHGQVIAAYWCSREPSGVALTLKTVRPWQRLWRKDAIVRLHSATDWITRDTPDIAHEIHQCETLGIRASEVLRGTSELVAMRWLLAAISRMLGVVDRPDERSPGRAQIKRAVALNRAELKEIHSYYDKAGESQGRLVYFQGMMIGAALLALVLGGVTGVLYLSNFSHWHSSATQSILIAVAMGAVGAIVSVMSRMAGRGRSGFSVDHEVGRKTVRRLGSFRPFIGATFALALYFAIESDLLVIGTDKKTLYFYGIVSFLAGFSERWAKILLDNAGRSATQDQAEQEEPAPAQ